MIHFHDIAILRRAPRAPDAARPQRLGIVDLEAPSVEAILHQHALLGHRLSAERARRRLDNSLTFRVFAVDGKPAVSTWIATGARYLDELNWLLPMAPTDVWLRDVFVAPAQRGQRLFADLVEWLAPSDDKTGRRVWSDVDWDNRGSMNAHVAAGFEVAHRVRAVQGPAGIRLRGAVPAWEFALHEIRPRSRVLRLTGDVLRRHLELLA